MEEKRCIGCGLSKPSDQFYVKRVRLVGIQRYPRCTLCYNRWTYRRHGKAYAKSENQREKERARDLLKKAVRDGRIKKPDRCDECGMLTQKRRLAGHHHDYMKPFDVRWLCGTCHRKAEKTNKEQA